MEEKKNKIKLITLNSIFGVEFKWVSQSQKTHGQHMHKSRVTVNLTLSHIL